MEHNIRFRIPEEEVELRACMNGISYHSVIFHIDNWARNKLKWDEGLTPKEEKLLQEMREEISNKMDELEVGFLD